MGLENLDGVPRELYAVAEALSWLGYEANEGSSPPILLDPDVAALRNSIRSLTTSSDVAVVYYTGHALQADKGPYYLLTTESNFDDLDGTALEVQRIPRLFLRRDAGQPAADQPAVLVILDCCYSGAGGIAVLREALQNQGNEQVWVLAAALGEQEAQQGLFAEALVSALTKPDVSHVADYIRLDAIREDIDHWLEKNGAIQRTVLFSPGGQNFGPTPPFFPNPHKIPGAAGLTLAEQRLWDFRLRGVPEGTTVTGFYTSGASGRVRAVEDLAAWMHSCDDGLALVTGSPGSGKSTLLALPTLLAGNKGAHYSIPGLPGDSLLARATELFKELPLSGLSARGKNIYEIAKVIADRMSIASTNYEDLLDILSSDLVEEPLIFVIDAVDEAIDPGRLMSDLLIPLSSRPGVRVLIAARRHLVPDSSDVALVVDLDAERYRDPQALVDFVSQLLLGIHEPEVTTPYKDAPAAVTEAVAEAIARRATAAPTDAGQAESFLLAQLLAKSLRSREEPAYPSESGWADQLPEDVGTAFKEDLARVGHREGKVRALLRALAWAQGPGLPIELWCRVAQALAREDEPMFELDASDVQWLLRNAGAYIIEDAGPDQTSVFRPYHDLLTAYLRSDTTSATSFTDCVKNGQSAIGRTEELITRALLEAVPTNPNGHRDWVKAHPYLRAYLARHARAAGDETFSELIGDLDYLAVADPLTLIPLLNPANTVLAPLARAYRRAHPLLGNSPSDNVAYIAESLSIESRSPQGQSILPTYITTLARVADDDSFLTLTGHQGTVGSMTFGRGADGQLFFASAGWDGTVRLWDTGTGAQLRGPLDHAAPVKAVAFSMDLAGRLMLVSASGEGSVRFWDPYTGTRISETVLELAGRAAAIAICATSNGRLLLASGGLDGALQIWHLDAASSSPGVQLAGHKAFVEAVAFGVLGDGKVMLASASADGTTRVWDIDTGQQRCEISHGGRVRSVALGTDHSGQLMLATAGWDGTVRLWDTVSGNGRAEPLDGHGGPVSAVVFDTATEGNSILASAGWGGALRLWDTHTGDSAGEPLLGHGMAAESLAFGTSPEGELILASGGRDGTIRLWKPVAKTLASTRLTGHSGPVDSLDWGASADKQPILASGSLDGTVRLWDPNAGDSIGFSLASKGEKVDAVALGTGPREKPFVAFATGPGTIRVWNPETGSSVSLGTQLGGVMSLAFGTSAKGQRLLASGGWDGRIHVWDLTSRTLWNRTLDSHTGPVSMLMFGEPTNGKTVLLSTGWDGTTRLWDLAARSSFGERTIRHESRVLAASLSTSSEGGQTLMTACEDGTVARWDSYSSVKVDESNASNTPVLSAAFGTGSAGNRLLAFSGADNTVRLWDPETGTTLSTIRRRTPARAVAMFRDSLALGDDEGVFVLRFPSLTGRF